MRCLRCDVHYRISIILMHPSWLLSLGRSSNRPLSAGIACLVYVKRELYDDFVDVATDSVACGVAGVVRVVGATTDGVGACGAGEG